MAAPSTELAVKIAVLDLAAEYAIGCDRQDWAAVVELFTADAVFDAEAVYQRTMRGPAELQAFFESAPLAAGHHPTNVLTTVHGPDSATAIMKMLVLFRSGIFSVDYEWQLVMVGERWRIAHQRIAVVGKVALPSSR